VAELQIIDGLVKLRGISFPADLIKSEMLETGGTVVSDEDINAVLDRAWNEYRAKTGKVPTLLAIEAMPGYAFVPRRIKLHAGRPGTTSFDLEGRKLNANLYFAIRRLFHA